MKVRRIYVVLVLGLLMCCSPLFAVLWSSGFAKRHGCTLHEGYSNPCVVGGVDYADMLYTAFVSGWFMLLTLPMGAALALILLVLVIRDIIRHYRSRDDL